MENSNKIKILSQELINQIAAGEVVERPASVVKELVENSIDAGATDIIVDIENGGLNLIKISDNGSGMNRTDARMSILQHATSKISSEDDLYKIKSLGFRGEALASVAAVSDFSLITKDNDSLAGTFMEIKNGNVETQDIGCPTGTTVIVKDLFYNIPARRKYLKTVVTEFNHIVDLFLNYCLAYPRISWKLVHNGKPVYQFPAIELEQRIADVLGEEVASNLIPIDIKLNEIHASGFIGRPQIARNNRKLQYLFINERPVNEFVVAKQVKDAYTTLIPNDLYPVYILNLVIENDRVDVNVHPRKLEVRFSEPQIVYRTVYQVVSHVLDENDLTKRIVAQEAKRFVPVAEVLERKQASIPALSQISSAPRKIEVTRATDFNKIFLSERNIPTSAERENQDFATLAEELVVKVLSQVAKSYILASTKDSIRIYDQHATSERIQYEKIKRQWQIGQLASQKMLLPQTIELTPAEGRVVENNSELLLRLGFDIAAFGGNSYVTSAVPQFLVNGETKAQIMEIIGCLEESVIIDELANAPLDKIFKVMACRSAIKFGDELTLDGMQALINDLIALGNNNFTCVHGRPCLLEFSFTELEKLFKRRG